MRQSTTKPARPPQKVVGAGRGDPGDAGTRSAWRGRKRSRNREDKKQGGQHDYKK